MPEPPGPILIVEDNPLNMKLAVDLLQLNGLPVLQATSGAAGLELASTKSPALILLDMQLPDMDGYEVFKRLNAQPGQSAKIVALTASAMREEEQQIRELGFHDFIAKPIDTKRFVQKVRELLAPPA
jgi:CheY-like chemotaxis protein